MPGLVLPLHTVMVQGKAEHFEMKVGANATPAKMLPGTLVILDTNENEVKEAGDNAAGVLGVIDVDHEHDIGDPYDNGNNSVGDNVPIIVPHHGSIVALRKKASEAMVHGSCMIAAADGLIMLQTAGAMGAQGDIIGQGWDTDSTAATTRVMVKWNYQMDKAAAT